MSTFATPPPSQHGSEMHDHAAQPVSSTAEQAATLDNHVNGDATSTNDFAASFADSNQVKPTINEETATNGAPASEPITATAMEDAPVVAKVVTEAIGTHPVDSISTPLIVQEAPAPIISDARNEEPINATAPEAELAATKLSIPPNEPTPEPTPISQPVVEEIVQTTTATAVPESDSKAQEVSEPAPDPMDVSQEPEPSPPTLLETQTERIITASPKISLHIPAAEPPAQAMELSPTAKLETTTITETPLVKDEEMADESTGSVKVAREREEDEDEGPTAKRSRTDDSMDIDQRSTEVTEFKTPAVPSITTDIPETGANDVITLSSAAGAASSTTPATPTTADSPNPQIADGKVIPLSLPEYGPLTDYQNKKLQESIRNLKKGKHSGPFQKPVDPVALGLPTYFDYVKSPMDLSLMETKLKNNEYKSVSDYVADFDLMVNNSIAFNGEKHTVTHNALNLRALFSAQLKKIPAAGETPPETISKKDRKASISAAAAVPPREPPRRASRPSFGAAQSPSSGPTYALDTNGLPQIRRDSSTVDGRPTREIRKPPPRDLPYSNAKPRKKKYQMELKFCEWVLSELKLPRYQNLIFPFKEPVDPVALNIPQYLKIIKHPMDLQTVTNKLQRSEYENAKEFSADIKLIFANCYKFNGENHAVSNVARELEKLFDDLWARKDDWIAENAPASGPHSPVVAESDSESEEEPEEEEEEEDPEATKAQLAQIQKQIAELSQQAMSLMTPSAIKPKKVKTKSGKKGEKAAASGNSKSETAAKASGGSGKRKSSGAGAGASAKSAKGGAGAGDKKGGKGGKRTKAITVAEKQEISANIGDLPADQIARAADIIKASLRRIGKADLADRPDGELEFDIDMIPDDTLHELLKLVRKYIPATAAPAAPSRASHGGHQSAANAAAAAAASSSSSTGKRKNKPMSKYEQEDRINRLKGQLQSFDNHAVAASSPSADDGGGEDPESSGDDDSGSESEEE